MEPGTREKLLHAAAEVFAERGFRESTVREICTRAGANIAAVNYHFRDKEGLYHAVLAELHRQGEAEAGMPEAVDGSLRVPGLTAAERLEVFVSMMARKMLADDPRGKAARIMAREMIEPTGALSVVAERVIRPKMRALDAIVAELLGEEIGDGPSGERVRLASHSVIGQLLFYKHARPMIELVRPEQEYTPEAIARVAGHITRFSLAAIEGLREEYRKGGGFR